MSSTTAEEDAMSSPLLGTSATSSPPPYASATSSPPRLSVPDAISIYASLADEAARVVAEISGLPESRGPLRRLCGDFIRRVRLLSPLLDEIRDGAGDGFPDLVECLDSVHDALVCARDVLRSVNDGSKIHQAYRREAILSEFNRVNEQMERALSAFPYNELPMSEEVREQVELVHLQFRRAIGKIDSPDVLLIHDLAVVWAQHDKQTDPTILKRISEKLQLKSLDDIKKESVALHELVISSCVDPDDRLEEMSSLLRKLKDFVVTENPVAEASTTSKSGSVKHRSPVIPDEFRCPISLELMQDPVIVSTGQTYERSCIQKWLDAGHKTCPKTQQNLTHTALTPNFILKSLISQWCESNGIEPPKPKPPSRDKKPGKHTSSSDCDWTGINSIMTRLENGTQEEQRSAAGELRLLAKRNANNRVCIAEAGAIPLLVKLLSSPDLRTQEHTVTALLNLSIYENNKAIIVESGAIPKIVQVLKTGSMEARENAAATLFSLSVVDQNKVAIGEAGAIPPLIDLLCQGSPRGKKDAATAIFNLCIFQGNKIRAVKAGMVGHLMEFLGDPNGGMIDEALAILAILASNQDGKIAVSQAEPVPYLVEVMKSGSPRNKENAAAILWSVCAGDMGQAQAMKDMGATEVLKELAENGSDRAKRKAGSLLELIQQLDVQNGEDEGSTVS
ncbi:hypothetical protein LUZ61_014977 [Rhynchospora tenuis]|uniref:RING-type E3 ubiquitin transferase n=1 Tax=Rhynchospora tenuis TaxID=198213 RepID=A0AAD5WDJ8_9POAL|nr:hypothetical protein LUZ61_014977 [Rhynchospora tenuis]